MTSGFNMMAEALHSSQDGVRQLLGQLCANQDKLVNVTEKLKESLQGTNSRHDAPATAHRKSQSRRSQRISVLDEFSDHPKWLYFKVCQ
jgi:hypothetical protein